YHAIFSPCLQQTQSYERSQDSPPPPDGWEQPTFDDSDWPRSRLTWLAPNAFGRFSSALLCLRGKFQVTDPAAVEGLYLTLHYYGGVRIWLNGTEVARQHLPPGKLEPNTPAEMYERAVYVDDNGIIVPFGDHEYFWNRIQGEQRKDAERRRANRTRVLGPIKLPQGLLRRGTNVLAIEVRRSEYLFDALRWFRAPEGATKPFWIPMRILDLRLHTKGAGAVPNKQRPPGIQVWTENTNDRITPFDYGDLGEGLRPIRIVGARNGTFCGQLVVGSSDPIRGLTVRARDLIETNNRARIPASCVSLLYALPDVSFYGMPTWFDALQSEPPAEVPVHKGGGAVQPVLVRVSIPTNVPGGNYRGEASVTVSGNLVATVPIELYVSEWIVPSPRNYRTYVGIYQSPTSLALQYKFPEWSEPHWKLVEKSFVLLSRAGNRLVNVTVVEKTQFGNEEGMITWVRQPDGSFGYDFRVFDRYMDLAQKYFSLDYVALHIWHSGGWETRVANQENTVTVFDPRTGTRESMQVPVFGTEESKRFWKPFLEAVDARLVQRGLGRCMVLGILSDGTAPPEVFKAFDEITPGGARWMRGCHSGTYSDKPYPLPGGGTVVLHEFCYGTPLDKAPPLAPYWKQRWWPGTDYERISAHDMVTPLSWYRETPITALMRRTRGVGRICLDFFDVLPGNCDIYNRWPRSSCAQREPSLKRLAWAAPDGPETTLRYEALCEGIQFAEALVVVSEALDTKADALGATRAAEYRQMLTELWRREVRAGTGAPLRPNHEGWQAMAKWLLDAAAQSSHLLATPAPQQA
ncbi:MAG: glycoside hydrolase domain-containing protein, partial [Kiritimatiellia bacterium]